MTPPNPEFDPLALIRVLNSHGVRFVVIGGVAAGVQGAVWATADLDLCYERSRANHGRLAAALAELQAVPVELSPGIRVVLDEGALTSGTNWTLATKFGRLDLLAEPGAGLDYPAIASRARRIEGQEAYAVAAAEDLIAMKRAAGRAKDIAQVELLAELLDEMHDD